MESRGKFVDFSWRDLTDGCWIAFYEFGKEIGVKYDDETVAKLKKISDYAKSGPMMSILLDGIAIVCRRPKSVNRDSQNRLHCEDGAAIVWVDGWTNFYWHGANVPAKLVMDPDSVTREEILKETNSEISRAYAEKLGWEKYFKLADVVRIDSWHDKKTELHYELYDFQKRLGEDQPRLLKMESPQVLDGTSPHYVEPVDPRLESAQAARRWQFMKEDGTWPQVDECNKSPELVFGWEA